VARKGSGLIDFPWKEQATLVRFLSVDKPHDQASEILFEGPLLAVAQRVRAMPARERRGLRLSLPDRHARPHSFQDDALTALIENLPFSKP
jgi:hypothetical protein